MDEFVRITSGRTTALVHPDYKDTVAPALLEGTGCERADLSGRTTIYQFPYGAGTGLIRSYRRGGFARHFVKDGYVLANRPLRELRAHQHVYTEGLSVPIPLGVCWEKTGVVYRGKFASAKVDAIDLMRFLKNPPPNVDTVLIRCGVQIRKMHELGVYHADLQLKNILVSDDTSYLIDFDNARVRAPLSKFDRDRNLLRLRRSIQKAGHTLEFFDLICTGYAGAAHSKLLGGVYWLKGRVADAFRTQR